MEYLPKLNALLLPEKQGHRIIKFSEITFCRAERNYTNLRLASGEDLLVSQQLNRFEGILPPENFFRCHHSYLVQLLFVEALLRENGNLLALIQGEKIPVSRARKSWLKARFYQL